MGDRRRRGRNWGSTYCCLHSVVVVVGGVVVLVLLLPNYSSSPVALFRMRDRFRKSKDDIVIMNERNVRKLYPACCSFMHEAAQ